MAASPKVVVVGLGAMGGAVAYHLARAGAGVLGIDAYEPPHPHGSSHGESRIIRAAYFEHPVFVPLVMRATTLWDDLAAEVNGVLRRQTGALLVGEEDSAVVGGALKSAAAHGIDARFLRGEEIARAYPQIRVTSGMVGVLEGGAGVLDAEGCVAAHLVAAEGHGATLRTGERVVGWEAGDGGVEVRTDSAAYRADHLVLAAGPWIGALLPALPAQLERQVLLWFEPRYSAAALLPEHMPVTLFETTAGVFYTVPDLGGGVKAARHHGGAVAPADRSTDRVGELDVVPVADFLRRHMPAAAGPVRRSVVCRYTNLPDGSFVIDHPPGTDRVTVVSACSGHGFKFASAIGEAAARQVMTGERSPLIEPFGWRF